MKTYVIVGAGVRSRAAFAKPLIEEWEGVAKLAGIYDINIHRSRLLAEECGNIPVYETFESMLNEVRPDVVIVVSTDSTHHHYIIQSLEAGCDVITEKPMTTSSEASKAILEAERRTGRKVTVTFNARFSSYNETIKQLLNNGEIGRPLHVCLETQLDRVHGADYFRRWHRQIEQSGGLLVHKATHHFDLMNWWLDDTPVRVSAFGNLKFYGSNGKKGSARCKTCDDRDQCEFYFDIEKFSLLQSYYLNGEDQDGYIRDACVFDGKISIYDNIAATVEYTSGTLLSFSMNAFSQYEGWRLSVEGTEGRLEAEHIKSGHEADASYRDIKIFKNNGSIVTHSMKRVSGGHSGGDKKLRTMLFGPPMDDPLNQQADSYAGALSLLVGVAANTSISEGRIVDIQSLLKGRENE